jgi:hypothetical protein
VLTTFFSADSFSSYWNIPLESQEVVLGSNLVSDVAAASFIPHSEETPLLRELLMFSSQFYQELSKNHHETGVEIRKGREFVTEARGKKKPWYTECVFNMTPCIPLPAGNDTVTQDPVVYLPQDKLAGWSFETFLIEPRFFIPWLRRQLEELHVTFEKKLVRNLSVLTNYDIVVNATGLGAKELACDATVNPIIGQILLLRYSGLDQWVRDTSIDGQIGYVYPQRNTVVVGGTKATEPRKDVDNLTLELKTKGAKLQTLISNAPVIGINCGYRPGRGAFRVEIDSLSLEQRHKSGSKSPIVIHNYGHSGEGYCFAPGCANHTVKLVIGLREKEFSSSSEAPLQAKL